VKEIKQSRLVLDRGGDGGGTCTGSSSGHCRPQGWVPHAAPLDRGPTGLIGSLKLGTLLFPARPYTQGSHCRRQSSRALIRTAGAIESLCIETARTTADIPIDDDNLIGSLVSSLLQF
jgi:hypothetical protein